MSGREATSTVIVADDDVIVRDILRMVLASVNQLVYVAADGLEALTLASRVTASLFVIDINMPFMNGLETCERLRRMSAHAYTPIAILTGTYDDSQKAAALRAGATTFLTKPFRPVEVLDALSLFLPIRARALTSLHRDAERARRIAELVPRQRAAAARPSQIW